MNNVYSLQAIQIHVHCNMESNRKECSENDDCYSIYNLQFFEVCNYLQTIVIIIYFMILRISLRKLELYNVPNWWVSSVLECVCQALWDFFKLDHLAVSGIQST